MTALNPSTCRRLRKLPQIPSVWEGDRQTLTAGLQSGLEQVELDLATTKPGGEYILWVDGSQGMVRAMDVVPEDAGPEAVVRTLLRAMEHPHSPAKPGRPQKIVVRNREILFFLRGVLQDLDITLDYAPNLPLIDEILRSFQEVASHPPQLPPQYADLLQQKARQIWQDGPWELLADHQVLEIELNQWDLGTLYASVMGMLGVEYGILLYRSLDSLRQFRERVMADDSMERMEEAFLGQDCLFLTFEPGNEDDRGMDLVELPPQEIKPVFGNLHPLEGIRSFLYDEEAAALIVVLESLHRFIRQHRRKLSSDDFPPLQSTYKVPLPDTEETTAQTIAVKISTLPDLAAELFTLMDGEGGDDEDEAFPVLREDLIPENAFLSLGVIPWAMLSQLRQVAEYYQAATPVTEVGDGLPVLLIQTSRPKAKTLLQELQAIGGVKAICFNPGEDPMMGDRYDLGLFQTGNSELHLFGEFAEHDPTHSQARKKWEQRCKKTKGACGIVIAKGMTGTSRGQPGIKDMIALFETTMISPEELGLGLLERQSIEDWL